MIVNIGCGLRHLSCKDGRLQIRLAISVISRVRLHCEKTVFIAATFNFW